LGMNPSNLTFLILRLATQIIKFKSILWLISNQDESIHH
jgi:hypothetical protein